MITSWTATTLCVLGTQGRYPLTPLVCSKNFPSINLCSNLLMFLSLILMMTVKPKMENFFSLKVSVLYLASTLLGIFLLVISQTSLWSWLIGKLLLPASSWAVPSRWTSILHTAVVSCCTSPLTHSVVAPLVWSSPVECLHLSTTSWILRDNFCRIILPQCLGLQRTENKFRQAGHFFTLYRNQVHKHKLHVLVCKHNVKPEPWQWLYSERSHHVCEHSLLLSRLSYTWASARPGKGVFVLLCNADVVQTSSSFLIISDAFLTKSAWTKRHNRLCHLL